MKQITDEYVAKRLGWEKVMPGISGRKGSYYWRDPQGKSWSGILPFTTDLSTIVREVEALELGLQLETYHHRALFPAWAAIYVQGHFHQGAWGESPAAAVAKALCAHLSAKPTNKKERGK